ncbi:MAG: glycosidase [Planctomycetota bacterium]|nr:MAG: glycosidase [Planctomycetota bacterium]
MRKDVQGQVSAMKNSNRELFTRHPGNPIITAKDIPYPANTIFNAAAARLEGETLLLLRIEDRRGFSHLTAARSAGGVTDWNIDKKPTLLGDGNKYPEEAWGIEDARITFIEDLGKWAVAYTAYSDLAPLVSLALTEDFKKFERMGPVLPPENKDAALFGAKFDGRYTMLHRPVPAGPGVGAHIWISFSPDLRHWGDHRVLLRARQGGWWDANKIGLSTPPLKTDEGWLLLYHGVRETASGCIYRLGLALLDLDDPTRVVCRSDEWVFGPETLYERVGDVGNVVFPCGWTLEGDQLRIYYGGADSCLALATGSLAEILDWLKNK